MIRLDYIINDIIYKLSDAQIKLIVESISQKNEK